MTLPAGTLIAGFRIDRTIGRGSRATVYEATQLSLNRRVALKVMDDRALADRVRRLSWPEHPGSVSLFATGDSVHGPWLAMRLVPGGRSLATDRARLDGATAALQAAHAAGIVHGDVTARNVLVADGRGYLSDFGLAGDGGTADDDRAALAGLVRERSLRRSPGRAALRLAAAVAIAGAVIFGVAVARDDGDRTDGAPPPAPSGTLSIGSDLAPGDAAGLDCEGRTPGGASQACTISQRDLAGRPVTAPVDGTITSWAVRGGRGPMSLQVLRGRGTRLVEVGRSPEENVPGPGPHIVRSDLAVAAGDRIALAVSPAAAIGLRRKGRRASMDRWFGPLLEPPRPPERPPGTGLDYELLLRVDITPNTGVATIEPLRGERATAAAPGRRLAVRSIAVGGGEVRTVAVVVLGTAVACDLFDGPHRLARVAVPGADGRGRLVALTGGAGAARVQWRNPGGRALDRRVAVSAAGLR